MQRNSNSRYCASFRCVFNVIRDDVKSLKCCFRYAYCEWVCEHFAIIRTSIMTNFAYRTICPVGIICMLITCKVYKFMLSHVDRCNTLYNCCINFDVSCLYAAANVPGFWSYFCLYICIYLKNTKHYYCVSIYFILIHCWSH